MAPGKVLYTPGLSIPGQPPAGQPITVKGRVYAHGRPCRGVAVTDGYDMVTTDVSGKYALTAHPQAEFIYISVPAGYTIPHNNGIAQFYVPIITDRPVMTADFQLEQLQQPDDKHVFIVWSDPQVQTTGQAEEVSTVSIPDLRATVATYPAGTLFHAMGCGDLAWDRLQFFDAYKKHAASSGIPFFQLIGNHDLDLDARSDEESSKTFLKQFGPSYYSFNRGKIHYVAIDNVFYLGTGRRFIGYITENQLQWLEKDLALVPAGTSVILCLHIPCNNGVQRRNKLKEEDFTHVVANREKLYKLLTPYHVHIMSGHTHFSEHVIEANIEEHIHGAVCGAWWTGPICWDGTPKGYGLYEIDGKDIRWYYKSIGHKRDHQMRLYAPGMLPAHPDHFVANIWNWDPKWKVEWLENGVVKGNMQQITGLDPLSVELYEGENKPAGQSWIDPILTDHLFIAKPSSSPARIEVRATDRFGNIYSETLAF